MNNIQESNNADIVKHNNKINWIKEISHKLNRDIPLNKEDLSFMMNMCTSDSNTQYGEFVKMLSMGIMDHPEFNEEGVGVDNRFKLIHLMGGLFKATAQVGRDSSAERKNNLSVLNKLTEKVNKHKQAKILKNHPMGQKSPKIVVDIPSTVVDDTNERNE